MLHAVCLASTLDSRVRLSSAGKGTEAGRRAPRVPRSGGTPTGGAVLPSATSGRTGQWAVFLSTAALSQKCGQEEEVQRNAPNQGCWLRLGLDQERSSTFSLGKLTGQRPRCLSNPQGQGFCKAEEGE